MEMMKITDYADFTETKSVFFFIADIMIPLIKTHSFISFNIALTFYYLPFTIYDLDYTQ